MSIGVVGRKVGMTRIFDESGVSTAVTVIEVLPNRVVRVKTPETDGYSALQVTAGSQKPQRVNKPIKGVYAAAGVELGRGLWEMRGDDVSAYEQGAELTVSAFEAGQRVDVSGVSIGKGFAGTVKRHNFAMQDATHGNSLSHRAPGSIGQNQTPGRVFKGKKMSGHMGAVNHTTQNLTVARVDVERNLLLIKGGVPGSKGSDVVVRPTSKG